MSLCMGCMQELNGSVICPNCHFDNSEVQSAPFLPFGTELAGRYVTGTGLETNGESTRYIAFDKQTGDVVIVSKNDKDISVGDIIQFRRNGKTVIHRIISEQKQTENLVYITKGDANNTADDGYVTEDDIVGKVIYSVPKIGYLTLWLHS